MSKTIDARGLTCPQPVILTKRVMDEKTDENIITIVDNAAATENVCKLAHSQGYDYTVEDNGEEHTINMVKSCQFIQEDKPSTDVTILIKSNLFGSGDDKLGSILMNSFMYALTEMNKGITHMIFMNSGVFLTTEDSPVLEHLQVLQEQGVEILSCGTCLDFFKLKDKLKVGQVTNMYTAAELLTTATKSLIF